MSNLQESILNEYKLHFPHDTLRDIAEKTDIQITRIFRLFNGSSMKLGEYETFKAQLPKKYTSEFNKLAHACTENLTARRLNLLKNQMIHSLKLSQMSQHNASSSLLNQHGRLA